MSITNIIKDPNTNWKYILIVLALSVLVGGGILGYQKYQLVPEEAPIISVETKKYSQERQMIGEPADGLVLKVIKHSDHGTFYRFVFEIKKFDGSDSQVIPSVEASYAMSAKTINILINGMRNNLAGPPAGEVVNIEGSVVFSYVQTKSYDDQALTYTISLDVSKNPSYYLHSLTNPARIIVDIQK